MDTFISPDQHVATHDDSERLDQIMRELAKLNVHKKRLRVLYRSKSSLLRYMRDIEPDIREVLGVHNNVDGMYDSGSGSDSDSDMEADAPSHAPRDSDSATIRDQLNRCSRYESEIHTMRGELSSMRLQHRRAVRHHPTDSSHNEMQRMAARLHTVAHSTILAAMHTGPSSSATNIVTGATMIDALIAELHKLINEPENNIPTVIERVIDSIEDYNSKLLETSKKTTTTGQQRNHYNELIAIFTKFETELSAVQTKIVAFSELESNFAVGLMAITGITMNVQTSVRDRLKDIIKMLQNLVGRVRKLVHIVWDSENASNEAPSEAPNEASNEASNEAPNEASNEASNEAPNGAPNGAPSEASNEASSGLIAPGSQTAMLDKWLINMNKFEQMLESQSPVFAAVNRVLSDLRMRYPILNLNDVDAKMMMDPLRNNLYACFQRLVGIDWNMSRRLSGQKVTYASDYNRMANQYRTTTFAFKKCRIVRNQNLASLLLQ
jgi:hypothetical protein